MGSCSGKVKKHQNSDCHSEAILNFIKMGKTRDIGVLLNFQKQTKQQQNRELIAITKVIAGQGLAFRRE